jgi:hypothetical protein
MTPKEKAKELFKKYSKGKDKHGWNLCEFNSCAIQCALIAVDEIINTNALSEMLDYGIDKTNLFYWEEVKQEIENL